MNLTDEDFERFRMLIRESSGIDLSDGKGYLVSSRLSSLLDQNGCESFADLYREATAPTGHELRASIIDAMTTNETLWFRDDGPWEVLRKALLPDWCERLRTGQQPRVRIWSAACSTGQEPYSVAIAIRDFLEDQPPGVKADSFEIVATDLSPSALFTAMSGRYSLLGASRGLSPDVQSRHFDTDGEAIVVHSDVKDMVRFETANLMEDFSRRGPLDLVLCRNVLIYFNPETRKEIAQRIHGVLRPGGALVMGGAESLQGALSIFKLKRAGTHLYYESKTGESKP